VGVLDVADLEKPALVEQLQDQAQLSLQQQAMRRLPSLTRFGRFKPFLESFHPEKSGEWTQMSFHGIPQFLHFR
jgi:hypothetical protein